MHAPKAPKAPKAQKRNQTKAQSTNNRTKIKNASKGEKVTYSLICVFVFFVCAKKRKQKKDKSLHNVNVLNTDVPTTTCVKSVWTH